MSRDELKVNMQVSRNRLVSALTQALADKTKADGLTKPNIVLATIVNGINNDLRGHFVATSQEDLEKISYAKESQYKEDTNKRIKTTLAKYIKRYYKDLYIAAGEEKILSLEDHYLNNYEKILNNATSYEDMLEEEISTKDNETKNSVSKEEVEAISSNREILLQAMEENAKLYITRVRNEYEKIIDYIRNNTDHYLSLSGDNEKMVSYSKDPINKYNSNKRTKLTLSRYIEKYVLPKITFSLDKKHIDGFENMMFNDGVFRRATLTRVNDGVFRRATLTRVMDKRNSTKQQTELPNIKINVEDKNDFSDIFKPASEIKFKAASEMKLADDRELLIKVMRKINESKYKFKFNNIISKILYDNNNHFLSLSQDIQGQVSYAKTEEAKFNNKLRTRNSLYKYIKRYISKEINHKFSKEELANIDYFCNDVIKEINYRNPKGAATREETIVSYDKDNKIIKKTTYNKNGVIQTENIFTDNKLVEAKLYESANTLFFKNGKIASKQYYRADGSIKLMEEFSEETGELVTQKLYNTSSNITELYNYIKGRVANKKLYTKDGGEVIYSYRKDDYELTKYDRGGNLIFNEMYDLNGKKIELPKLSTDYVVSKDEWDRLSESEKEQLHNKYGSPSWEKKATDTILSTIKTGVVPNEVCKEYPILEEKEKSILKNLKIDASKAGYRVAANQISKGIRRGIVSLMRSNGMNEGKIKSIEDVLDSEAGLVIVNMMMGYALEYSKYSKDLRVKNIAREFRVEGMAKAGNVMIDELVTYIGPAIKKSIDDMPDTKFRIEEKKKTENKEICENEIALEQEIV